MCGRCMGERYYLLNLEAIFASFYFHVHESKPGCLCPCRPYSVTPPTGTLAVNTCMQATISFAPKQVGEHSGELLLCYDNGEKIYTKLYGSANDVNIRLDKSSVSVENTFIGLSSHR